MLKIFFQFYNQYFLMKVFMDEDTFRSDQG